MTCALVPVTTDAYDRNKAILKGGRLAARGGSSQLVLRHAVLEVYRLTRGHGRHGKLDLSRQLQRRGRLGLEAGLGARAASRRRLPTVRCARVRRRRQRTLRTEYSALRACSK